MRDLFIKFAAGFAVGLLYKKFVYLIEDSGCMKWLVMPRDKFVEYIDHFIWVATITKPLILIICVMLIAAIHDYSGTVARVLELVPLLENNHSIQDTIYIFARLFVFMTGINMLKRYREVIVNNTEHLFNISAEIYQIAWDNIQWILYIPMMIYDKLCKSTH
jgi:hypothetical protein